MVADGGRPGDRPPIPRAHQPWMDRQDDERATRRGRRRDRARSPCRPRYPVRCLSTPLGASWQARITAMLASRMAASPILNQIAQIAWERGAEKAIERFHEAQRAQRASKPAAGSGKRADGSGPLGVAGDVDASDGPNARTRARPSWGVTAADVQAARDMRLCMARTRQGYPCTRRVVPGRNRCPSHGGLSSGPKTQEGRERIARAARERWRRHRGGRSR